MITADTTVGRLLEAHPQLVEFLASYHPHFAKLRNGLIRRLMAPRVTVADAARMAGLDAGELVRALRRAVGEPEGTAGEPEAGASPAAASAVVVPQASISSRRGVVAAISASSDARRVHSTVLTMPPPSAAISA